MASRKTLRGAPVLAAISLVGAALAFVACGSSDDDGSGSGTSKVTGTGFTPIEAAAQPPIPPGAGPAPPGPPVPGPMDASVPPKDAVADAPIVDATGQ